ncbi:MAG: hypothetical protein Q8M20_05145 [Rhodocyclaceae bacterium]|nr:hypothetical protein [Rhodocyclaceae bacterium]MDZ4214147.1 hypothetical protein [Rhodocyclaceae bacterium]
MACHTLVFRITLLLLLASSWPAQANDRLRVSGFGTLGYTADNNRDIYATRDISQLPNDDYRTGANWLMDTRVGLQLEYKPHEQLDLVAQVVARDHFKADLDSTTELAYLAWHPRPQLDLRLGRIPYDAFLMSDHRNVGYAYTWVRPPMEFYGWIPIFSLDGADANYQWRSGDASWDVKAQLGKSQLWVPVNSGRDGGYLFKANNLAALSLTRQTSLWRVKLAHSRFTSGNPLAALAPLHAGLDAVAAAAIPGVSAEAAELREEVDFYKAKISYTTFGAVYDDNTWVVQAELGVSTSTKEIVPSNRMAYASVARRFGDWTPFVVWSVSRPQAGVRQAANNWGGSNATVRDPAIFLANSMRINQETVSLGVRWDLHTQAALKLQLDSTRAEPPGAGLWLRAPQYRGQSSRLNQLTATLDFVF